MVRGVGGVFVVGLVFWGGLACGDDGGGSTGTEAGSTSSSGSASTSSSDGPGSSGASSTSATSATSTTTTSSPSTTGDSAGSTGGDAVDCGTVIFSEPFEDTDFASRGWYDAQSGTLSTTEFVEGSTASLECRFAPGATGCEGGTPGRLLFDGQTSVCLSYWVKYSSGYVGSGVGYHPHEFHFVTNLDDMYVGPANTSLTTYTEQVGGVPRLAIQDSRNVDLACVLLNNDTFVGCDGDFDTYVFDENRSAAACNGILGDLDGRDCFSTGTGYYSARFWDADAQVFGLDTQWHRVVSLWQLNDIEDGVGIPNGVLRYWVDGELLVSSDQILLRTGAHPDMVFNQFLIAPYIGDGSPVDQTMWIDDLTISIGTP